MSNKLIQSTLLVLFIFMGHFVAAQRFVKVGGAASDIAISPKDGEVYVIGKGNIFYNYNERSRKWALFGTRINSAKSVSIDKRGKVYITTSISGDIQQWTGSNWDRILGITTWEVTCPKDGSDILVINTHNNELRQFQKSKIKGKTSEWIPPRRVVTKKLKQVVALRSDLLYARDLNNAFVKYARGRWYTLNGNPLKIALDHKTGIIYAVGRNKGIYKWISETEKWELLAGTRKDFKDLAVHDGKIWAVATNGSIYYYDPPKSYSNRDFSGTYRVSVNSIGSIDKNKKYYGLIGIYLRARIASKYTLLKPLDDKPNRIWDIPLDSALPAKGKGFVAKEPYSASKKSINAKSSLFIDKIREFRLAGEAAKGDPELSLEMNVKRGKENLPGMRDVGEWENLKVKLGEIELGKEYYYYHVTSGSVISFTVTQVCK